MDSFANTDRVYSDGQRNKEAIPDEITTYGFKPPVRLPDGSIEAGDYLAANHLNFILNDIYKRIQSGAVVESVAAQSSGYRRYADGRIEMWGLAQPNASGIVAVTYPVRIPFQTNQIFFSNRVTSPTTITRSIIVSDSTVTGFTVLATKTVNAATSTDNTPFAWRAFYDPVTESA